MEKLLYRDRKKERLPRIGEDMRKGKPGYAIAKTLLQQFTSSQPLAWIQPVGIGGHSAMKRNNGNSNTNDDLVTQPSQFKIYPNPANNTISIAYQITDKTSAYSMSIFDITGNRLNMYQLPAGQSVVTENVSNLAEGFYLYSISDNGNIIQRGKIIITR